jgi:hypothetical protein
MNKITPQHLVRDAYVYVRQSTADQLTHNPESRRRQYALKGRAEALGWQNVVVIDDDLGRSGGGVARRDLNACLLQLVMAAQALCWRSRHPVWLAMVGTGIPCSSSVAWWDVS